MLTCSTFIEIALEHCMCSDFFAIKFLQTGEPKNEINIGLRQGLAEILVSHANSLYHKVEKKKVSP